jgi:NitT/TauT family transport system permease protein
MTSAETEISRARRIWRRVDTFVYPVVTIAALVGIWHLIAVLFDVPQFILPKPGQALSRIVENRGVLIDNLWPTLKGILGGYLLAILVGIPLAVTIVANRTLEKMIYPLLVISQTVPKVAILPLILIWVGTGIETKILIAFVISFFPIVIDTAVGLQSVPTEMIDLARSMGGTKWAVFRKVRFIHALPSVFAGLKVGITLATIGAVFAEMLASNDGLGYVVRIAQGRLNTAYVIGTVIVIAAVGIVLFVLVEAAERAAIPWHVSRRRDSGERSLATPS